MRDYNQLKGHWEFLKIMGRDAGEPWYLFGWVEFDEFGEKKKSFSRKMIKFSKLQDFLNENNVEINEELSKLMK